VLAINGTEDHLHILTKLRPDKALSDVMRELKVHASSWMHDVFPPHRDFHGKAVMGHSPSVNRISARCRIISPDKKSIIDRNLSAMN
jgi:REP element-mobilizing transposase RayT